MIVSAKNGLNGRPVESHLIMEKLNNFIKGNGLRPVVFHSLRHSSTSLKLKISGGNIKSVQGDTGHSQARMVTDVCSHIMTDDRKNLARKVNDQFLIPGAKEKAAEPSAVGLSPVQIIQLLKTSPDLADPVLQMYNILGAAAQYAWKKFPFCSQMFPRQKTEK